MKVLGSSDDRFREMFFEEAREHLISLEEGLMDLERRQGDRAHLDKTFRAAHTIKGAAAMVGLEPIARFTHGIEAVLEKIRTGSLAVDSDIITTLLESRDHLAAMVEGYAAGSPVPGSGDLSQRLSDLLRVTPPGPAPAPSRPRPRPAPSRPEPGSVTGRPAPAIPAQTKLPLGPPQPAAPAATPNDATAARGDVAGCTVIVGVIIGARRAPGTGPIKPRPRASRAKKKEGGEPKARPRQSKSRAMDKADPTGPAGAGPSAAASESKPPTGFPIVLLPDQTVSGTGHPPPGRQSAGRAGRTARAGRVDRDHRSAGRPLAGRARPGTLLPELDHHGPDRRRAGATEGCFPLRLRGQQRARRAPAG